MKQTWKHTPDRAHNVRNGHLRNASHRRHCWTAPVLSGHSTLLKPISKALYRLLLTVSASSWSCKMSFQNMPRCTQSSRLEDPARVRKAGRAKRAPPSILRAGEMRQTKVEAAPTALRSPNFWAGCSQDPAAINHWPRCNYIVLSNYSTTYQRVDACLAITVRSERKQSRTYSEAMTTSDALHMSQDL